MYKFSIFLISILIMPVSILSGSAQFYSGYQDDNIHDLKDSRESINCTIQSSEAIDVNKGMALTRERKYKEATAYLLNLSYKYTKPCVKAKINRLIGDGYKKQNKLEDARDHLQNAENYFYNEPGYETELAYTYKSLGQVEDRASNYKSSCDYYTESLKIFNQFKKEKEINQVKVSMSKLPSCDILK